MNAIAIQEAYEKFIEAEERRGGAGPRETVYASSWSACTRAIALDLIAPEQKSPFPVDTLANFRRGNDRGRDIKADMMRVGRFATPPFEVVGSEERFVLRDRKGRPVITGKVDFRLKFQGQKSAPPVELKSWHPNLIQGIKSFGDLFRNRFTRRGAHQLLSYLYGSEEPLGFFLLDRPGIPRPLEVRLVDYMQEMEDFLSRAEIAMDARDSVQRANLAAKLGSEFSYDPMLPPYHDDPDECRHCSFFGGACNPPLSFPGATIITEDEVLAQIVTHEALGPAADDYGKAHKELSDYLKARTPKEFCGGKKQTIIAGEYIIETTWTKNTTTDLSGQERTIQINDVGGMTIKVESLKSKYQSTDPAGKFSMKIIRAKGAE